MTRYLGPRYYGHPFLDGRGVFLDGNPLDDCTKDDPCCDADLQRHDPPRTKDTHPYAYDPFTIWGQPYRDPKQTGTVYADRLMQWDRAKYARLARKHYHSGSNAYEHPFESSNCKGFLIAEFLRDWFDDPSLELLRVVEHCNPYTGERNWSLSYSSSKEGMG